MASARVRKSVANLTHRVAVVVSLAAFVGCATPTEWRRQQQKDFEEEEAQIVERQPAKKPGKRKRRRKRRRSRDPAAPELDGLALKLGAAAEPIENPCKNPLCTSRALDPFFKKELHRCQDNWRKVVSLAVLNGVPTPAFSSALAYFDGYRSAVVPANLLQAQRDYFGAHTYERTDKPRGQKFHVDWPEPDRPQLKA